MSGIVLNSSTDVTLPEWLQKCLHSSSAESAEAKDDQRTAETALIRQAFEFAYILHQGQYRKSGEPYICHPIAVAGLLREFGGSAAMIAAGFLHDVVEDTDVTSDDIEQHFGVEVRQLVEGVTKLSKLNFKSKTESQAENFRRMFLAMAQDIRVIVVKLADRLHNMRTLQHLPEEKRRRIALETREIFAPLANRLGMWRVKSELEDLAFKYLEPDAYEQILQYVAENQTNSQQRLTKLTENLRQRLQQAGIGCLDMSGHSKHLYGMYQKMLLSHNSHQEIYDLAALRILVKTHEECYRALAIVHDAFRPIPGKFKDYIGLPKPNRYQSLHTVVIGPWGRPLEVQIRTLVMHHVSEYGIAAQWKYKEAGGFSNLTPSAQKFNWLRQLLEWQNDLKDAHEYLESIKDNLFEDDVYVFTPKGDLVSLNPGSTTVDFAYRIHTEVGNHCAGSRVNGRRVPLSTRLQNGDIVEIITQKNSRPSLDWLNFVRTPAAKNRIKQWYKQSRREENVARGRELLEKELGKTDFESLLKSEQMQTVAQQCHYKSVEDLLTALGYGEITLNLVLSCWREVVKAQQPIAMSEDKKSEVSETSAALKALRNPTLNISRFSDSPMVGVEGLVYHLAECCNPIPGEAIIGVVVRSKEIIIHRHGCDHLANVRCAYLVPVSWKSTTETTAENNGHPQTYPVNVQIEALNRVGVLKDILSRLSDQGINVRHAQVKTAIDQPALIDLEIDVRDRTQLEQVFTQIEKLSAIQKIRRVSQIDN